MHHLAKVAWGLHLTGGSNPPLSVAAHAARPVPPGARVRFALLIAVLHLAACGSPRWSVVAEPPGTRLVVDGAVRRGGAIDEVIPYYGVVDLVAVPRAGATTVDGVTPLTTSRATLRIDEPVTPWIFPFDFVAEVLRSPFVDDPTPSARLVAPPRTDVAAPGAPPPGIEAFLVRARAATAQR